VCCECGCGECVYMCVYVRMNVESQRQQQKCTKSHYTTLKNCVALYHARTHTHTHTQTCHHVHHQTHTQTHTHTHVTMCITTHTHTQTHTHTHVTMCVTIHIHTHTHNIPAGPYFCFAAISSFFINVCVCVCV
jgi:hypothetical protein